MTSAGKLGCWDFHEGLENIPAMVLGRLRQVALQIFHQHIAATEESTGDVQPGAQLLCSTQTATYALQTRPALGSSGNNDD
ncbi:hypothetical protein D3C77_395080 [compost metagenome]